MIVLSYNVRGLGGAEKRAEVWQLVREKHPSVLCIQESKLSVVDDLLVKSIWGMHVLNILINRLWERLVV